MKVDSKGDFNAIIKGHRGAQLVLLLLLTLIIAIIIEPDNSGNTVTGQTAGKPRFDFRQGHRLFSPPRPH
jgi:hypothetical protein